MDGDYLEGYAELYHNHWWWRAREDLVMREIRRLWPDGQAGRILDVGCGDGLLFPRLKPLGEPYGVELEERAVSPDNPDRARIHIGPFEGFRAERPFDLVLMLDVLEHLDHPEDAIRAVHGLLRPGGVFLLTVPAFMALWTRHDELNRHRTRYRRRRLEPLLRDGGFVPETMRYFFHWVAPVKLAVRLLERLRSTPPAAPALPPPPINWILAAFSAAENRLMRVTGLPFGSSLLAVARRPVGEGI